MTQLYGICRPRCHKKIDLKVVLVAILPLLPSSDHSNVLCIWKAFDCETTQSGARRFTKTAIRAGLEKAGACREGAGVWLLVWLYWVGCG